MDRFQTHGRILERSTGSRRRRNAFWEEQAKRLLQREGIGRRLLRALVVVTLQHPLPNVTVLQTNAKAHHGFSVLLQRRHGATG